MMSQSAMQINSLETASGKWFRDAGVSSTGVSVKPETHHKHIHGRVKPYTVFISYLNPLSCQIFQLEVHF
jgi:hypothetical protein